MMCYDVLITDFCVAIYSAVVGKPNDGEAERRMGMMTLLLEIVVSAVEIMLNF